MISAPVIQGRAALPALVLSLVFFWTWVFAAPMANAHSPEKSPVPAGKFPVTIGGAFTLIDHQGRERTDKDFRGRYLLVFFGYTFCPDTCPTGLQTIGRALDLVGGAADKVQPVFITVDPDRDTPKALRKYVANFHPRLIGLTGSEKQVADVARVYRVFRGKVPVPDKPKEEYLVAHTSNTYLMGPDGKLMTLFPNNTNAEVMAKALSRYLSGGGS